MTCKSDIKLTKDANRSEELRTKSRPLASRKDMELQLTEKQKYGEYYHTSLAHISISMLKGNESECTRYEEKGEECTLNKKLFNFGFSLRQKG